MGNIIGAQIIGAPIIGGRIIGEGNRSALARYFTTLAPAGSQYYTIPEITLTGDFSVSFDCMPTSFAAVSAVTGKISSNTDDYVSIKTDGVIKVRVGFTSYTFSTLPLTLHKLSTCTMSRTGSDITLTVNGVSETKSANTSSFVLNLIGGYHTGNYFSGVQANVKITDAGVLKRYYKIDESWVGSTSLLDSSGNNQHGIAVNITSADPVKFTKNTGAWLGPELIENGQFNDRTLQLGSIHGDSFSNNSNDLGGNLDTRIYVDCTNRGVGGNKLSSIAAVMLSTTPVAGESFVILQGGINDIITASTDPNTSMRASMQSMIDEANSLGLNWRAINIAPFKAHVDWNTDRQSWVESYNAWLLSTYATAVVDMYSTTEDPSTPDTLLAAFDNGDGLHLNTTGSGAVDDVLASSMTFADPLPAWTMHSDWSIGGGTANSVSTSNKAIKSVKLAQVGFTYQSTYTVSSYASGRVRFYVGGFGPYEDSVGTYTHIHTPVATAILVSCSFSAGFVGSIDNVSVKQILEVA